MESSERNRRNRLEQVQADTGSVELALAHVNAAITQATDDAEAALGRRRIAEQKLREIRRDNRSAQKRAGRWTHNWRLRLLQAGQALSFLVPGAPLVVAGCSAGLTWGGLGLVVFGIGWVAVGCLTAHKERIE